MKIIKNVNLYGSICDIGVENGKITAIGALEGEGVDFGGGASDGMSIVDVDKRYFDREPNCNFAFSANREKFVALLTKLLKAR